jgi:hypothetical protein
MALVVQRDAGRVAAALGGPPRAGALDEDLPHQVGRDRHEVRAVLRLEAAAPQARPGFVHERRGLECRPGRSRRT